ncbi:MAG: phenylalanine--tRNA ligase subunit alpha [Thermomicrobiales bacterium]|nr:phenylalanine--tRNA ligase subunit alpha [Thermomicrobiales bacterium]
MSLDALTTLRAEAEANLRAVDDLDSLTEWERSVFGPKGSLTLFLRSLGAAPAEERPALGRAANEVKNALTVEFETRKTALERVALASRLTEDAVDMTLPGRAPVVGVDHPISQTIRELSDIFSLLGFQTVFGPEVETGRYNFDLLNIPSDHPARDVWDTMIVDTPNSEIVLRTHTSPMQARVMEQTQPPVRVVVPGRTYRFEQQDASHEWAFHQLEGLAVDQHITMTDLKGTLREMARQLFGADRRIRFRCDFFPFVEPGVDFSIDCMICNGSGCRVCKQTGWLEMGGAGMVHPSVLEGVGYDSEKYTGFAFGLGIERIIIQRYGVNDIRAFAGNDLRFLKQFATVNV